MAEKKRTDALLRSITFVLSFAGLSAEAKREPAPLNTFVFNYAGLAESGEAKSKKHFSGD
ncbi:MAG TPA: hypothetical protein DD723_03075 [Candidatus Omnitrophica bacterium]|nr:MAG: hypothetical protein A2Z81_01200 [Omnitrophica WOR_2 bacterium GWA2_45_18]HBR14511.1 hypothetical protein [Candidatus Omnitrophota bacterium]